ncbi:hypothetical protein SETIT_7G053900v2 [Setaria italica]|uniref:Cytochrome P450 n=1 Tax=Setaria italica TaxID=4555 RepID=K3Y719_SETIT|nr:hypothetical protein SETIT_7G053900v2 [Setaria italica]
METLQLLWIALATIVFVGILLRSTRHAPYTLLQPTVEISNPDVARRMLFDHADAFSNRPTKPFPLDFDAAGRHHSISTIPYGPSWGVLRRSLTAGILHPTRLGLLEQAQREAVESFVADLYAARRGDAGGEVVVRDGLRHAIYTLMARLCFGEGAVDEHDVRAIDRAQMEFLFAYAGTKAVEATRLPRVLYRRRWLRLDAAFNRLSYLMITLIIAARRRWTERGCGGGGGGSVTPYVDSLFVLRVPADDAAGGDRRGRLLTDAEMGPIVWEFILAGAETWVLAHLVARPEVQEKVHRQVAGHEEHHLRTTPPYLRAVILECLRIHPALPSIMREVGTEAAAAAAVGGATAVAEGDATMHFKLNASDIGRSREAWTDPDEFRPERFLAGGEGEGVALVPGPKEVKMVPFGAGRRYCPGAALGMLHVGCFVAAAVREFEWSPAAKDGGGVDFTEMDMFFNVMKTQLRARITPRRKT